MVLEIETDLGGEAVSGLKFPFGTRLKMKTQAVNGLYTGLWVKAGKQVIDHRDGYITIDGHQDGGLIRLLTSEPVTE